MSSQQIDGNHRNHRRKKVAKEEKWEKQTKMVTERVGSAISSFFGGKKQEIPAVRSSKAIGRSRDTWLDRSSGKMGSVRVSKARKFLSNLFRKGKIRKIAEKGQSGSGQGKENETAGSNLTRVSSRRVSARPKLKIARSMRSRGSNRVGGESEPLDEDSGFELCKRRILMGGKCKPLHSGDDVMFSEK